VSSEQLSVNSGGAGLSAASRFFLRMYSRVARSRRLFTVSQKFAALGSFLLAPFSPWIHLPAATGWGYSKDFPRFAGKTFRERYKKSNVTPPQAVSPRRARSPNGEHRGAVSEAKSLFEKTGDSSVATLPQNDINKVESFTNELTMLGGQVHDANDATEEIIQFLKSRGIDKIHLEPNVLNESVLKSAGIEFTHEPDPDIRAGVTRAICGLADTGSMLEADGVGSPLHASLLPEVHIAVLNKSDILPSLSDAMHLIEGKRAAAFITGPSRTADIEMTLTIGVHGPKEIAVFLV
jgi:hypothetical protein